MSDRYARRLLEHLKHEDSKPALIPELMLDLGIDTNERDAFAFGVDTLHKAGKLTIDEKGRVGLPTLGESGSEVTGSFRKNPKGFGFVILDVTVRTGDVFIPPDGVSNALTGDKVRIKIVHRGDDTTGRIVEVISRKRQRFTGLLSKSGSQWLVMPDGRELTRPVVVRDPEAKNAHEGDKVVVEITAYPEGDVLPEGVITEVLGEAGLPSVETQAVIATYDLPGEFEERCYEQARRATEQYDEEIARSKTQPWSDRDDLRDEFIITIDPPDAKDYDDAISISASPEGWELGIHIADVAHFIPPGSPLDSEAQKRGNSCYLPRLVIPMLPENLSNGICSLQEGVPRYCKSAFMAYNRRGEILRSGVSQVCILSKKRLTYIEAQFLIDGDETEAKKHAKTEPNYTPQLLRTLKEMDACAKAIRHRRRLAGMIHLDLPSVELVFDNTGRVIDAHAEDDSFTHTLIEMFMVEANEVVARLFARLHVPLIRRVHPEPIPGNVDDLRSMAKVAGFSIPKRPTRQELQSLLDATAGTAAAPAVHFAVLRTLTKAEYSPALIGHFALASEAYAHFTSPIRRYPDLTVHRALAAYLQATNNGKSPPPDDESRKALGKQLLETPLCPDHDTLVSIGKKCSQTEENAASAENDLRSFLVMQLLADHVGESFPGMVTNVNNAGIFVRLEKYLADGFIKSEELPVGKEGRSGAWRIDQRSGALVNMASGRSFATGDRLEVTIAKVDLALRRMDLLVTDANARDRAKVKKLGAKQLGKEETKIAKADGNTLSIGGASLSLDWDQLKHGKDGAAARSQRSKARDKGKTNHRRDK